MKTLLSLVMFLFVAGCSASDDSGSYAYKSNGTNDLAGMTEHIRKLRLLIKCDEKVEECLRLEIEVQRLRIRLLEDIISKTQEGVK